MAWFPYPGPGFVPIPLAPGQTIGRPEDVVLRGSRVRLGVSLLPNGREPMRSGTPFHTQALKIDLLSPDAPTVQLKAETDGPVAMISRPAHAHGLPKAVWYANCGPTNDNQDVEWTAVGTHLRPSCSPLHLICLACAGWMARALGRCNRRSTSLSTTNSGPVWRRLRPVFPTRRIGGSAVTHWAR
jgi:hypothetical protein